MSPDDLQFLDIGSSAESRRIALKTREGSAPAVIWLGGFRSDMEASKAQAIELDLARRGLPKECAAAIGDSTTDIQMADAVGLGVLVGNAFASPGVIAALDATPRENVARTAAERGDDKADGVRHDRAFSSRPAGGATGI